MSSTTTRCPRGIGDLVYIWIAAETRWETYFYVDEVADPAVPPNPPLVEAGCQLGGGIKIVFFGHFECGQLAQMATLIMVPPAFEQASRRYMGFFLHGFNQVMQKSDAGPAHAGQFLDVELVARARIVQQ